MVEVLDVHLSPLISWPEREELWRTMPRCFQYSFGKATTIIIDCFEIYIDRPSNLLARAQTYLILIIRATTLSKFLLG